MPEYSVMIQVLLTTAVRVVADDEAQAAEYATDLYAVEGDILDEEFYSVEAALLEDEVDKEEEA